jgi:3D (Asp-Asp-Asp) domain-containing protein/sulfur carrier protein ThiS
MTSVVAVGSLVNASILTKDVTLVVAGKATQVATNATTVGVLLEKQHIQLNDSDYISVAPSTKLEDGLKIVIRKPVEVQFQLGNQIQAVNTTAGTVKGFVEKLGISPKVAAVSPALDTKIVQGLTIRLNDVKTVVTTKKQKVAFSTVTRHTSSLTKGRQRVLQSGQTGEITTKIEKQYYHGKLISVREISSKQTKKASNRILAIGTAKPVAILSANSPDVADVTKNGVNFDYKRVLHNVELSAYDAGFQSTGKVKGQAGYGHTATGTTVTEGRTIAVDPNVIPLGWWVYIEGVGFRKAEDRGSAVRGNEIDVYFDSHYDALNFGRRYGKTVYVIGPNKP